jgi:hypothetical protein
MVVQTHSLPTLGLPFFVCAQLSRRYPLKADDVRALNHVREREGAEIALLISLAEPTSKMKADAASAGIYSWGVDDKLKAPRVQLLTIDGLLSGRQRAEHPDYLPNVTFKKAKREKGSDPQKRLGL